MRYENFKLFQLIRSLDNYGNSKNDYEFIEDIAVCLNEKHIAVKGTDTLYFAKSWQGVTPFNQFELGQKYKISNSYHDFTVQSFINGRLTQLVFDEVEV